MIGTNARPAKYMLLIGFTFLLIACGISVIPTQTNQPAENPLQEITPTTMVAQEQTNTPLLIPLTPTLWTRPADGMEMVYVPEGNFIMGSMGAEADESPQHTVYLDAYWIDRTEVTNAQYARCVQAGACTSLITNQSSTRSSYYGETQYDNFPVIVVDWYQAHAYCAWAGGRLPSEAEWEKAARGTDGRTYPWGETAPTCSIANHNPEIYEKACVGDTTAVGSYPSGASPYGVQDMAGNVLEWVNDWYDPNYYSISPSRNPQGPSSGEKRVLRGGDWYHREYNLRAGYRYRYIQIFINNFIGFRCVRDILP